MGVIAPLQRTLLSRCLVYYRAAPEVVAPLLPEGLEPAHYRGFTLVGLSWSRVRGLPGGLLPRALAPTSDELAFCFSVEPRRPTVDHGVWVPLRDTSSRLSAHWAGRVLGGEYHLAQFDADDTPTRLELVVRFREREELYLRAEPCDEFVGSVFLSARQVEDYLQHSDSTRPRSALVPDAPDLSVAGGDWAVDPLSIFELRCPYFEDTTRFPEGSLQLDSAFRMVRRRSARATEPADLELNDGVLGSGTPYVPV